MPDFAEWFRQGFGEQIVASAQHRLEAWVLLAAVVGLSRDLRRGNGWLRQSNTLGEAGGTGPDGLAMLSQPDKPGQ
ncbi:hypothetical protein LT493_11470 [Streptomyces tricolor]|nr:hypothetical protein [Streptomyces tricolor]